MGQFTLTVCVALTVSCVFIYTHSSCSLVKAGSEAIDTPFDVRNSLSLFLYICMHEGVILIACVCFSLQACALNFNYTDNGLFGFYVISEPQNAGKVWVHCVCTSLFSPLQC